MVSQRASSESRTDLEDTHEDYSQQQYADDAPERRNMEERERLVQSPPFECNTMCMSDFMEVPENAFLCPISRMLMRDPVVAADGMTYERTLIEDWITTQTNCASSRGIVRSPVTGGQLSHSTLTANQALKSMICSFEEEMRTKYPELIKAIEEHNKMCHKANEELNKLRAVDVDIANDKAMITSLSDQNYKLSRGIEQLRQTLRQRDTELQTLQTAASEFKTKADAELRMKCEIISQLSTDFNTQKRVYEGRLKKSKLTSIGMKADIKRLTVELKLNQMDANTKVNLQVIDAICTMAKNDIDMQVCICVSLYKLNNCIPV